MKSPVPKRTQISCADAFDVKYGDVKRIPFITKDTNADTKAFAETILRFGLFVDTFGEDDYGSKAEETEMDDNEEEGMAAVM